MTPLSPSGRPAADILADLADLRQADLPLGVGRTWAYVYDIGLPEAQAVAEDAFAEMLAVNALDPTAFPSVVRLENEVVAAVGALLGAGPTHTGTFTSGGTESIMLAVKAARDSNRDVERPTIVAPETVHPAFHKAAAYLGLEVVTTPVDPVTFRGDASAIAAAIDERTVLVVASAVSYPHGVLDPVAEIASAAAERDVLCHVDACVGGMLLPFLRRQGEPIAPFDLSVPGVTSMSADLHKYGYAPKGASVVLFRDAALRRASYFASAGWPGYTVVNAGVQSSRSGGPVAASWALLSYLGEEGYLGLATRAREAARTLIDGVAGIDGLRVLGDPPATLIAIAGDGVDVFVVADELRERGQFAQVQLSFGSSPANLHLSTFGSSPAHAAALVDLLAESVAAARTAPPVDVPEGLSDALASFDPATLTDEVFAGLVAALGVDLGSDEIGRMATINTVLDAAPVALREALLEFFLGAIYTPRAGAPV